MVSSPHPVVVERSAAAMAGVADAFERAWAVAADASAFTCELAGRPARVRVAGAALHVAMRNAIGHLTLPDATTSLSIDLWDPGDTAVPPPRTAAAIAGERQWRAGPGFFAVSADSRFVRYGHAAIDTWYDRTERRIVGWMSQLDALPLYERGKPLHHLLSVWHHDCGAQIIHAALVAADGQGVLLPGVGGSGKTTVSVACLLGGFDFLGDDHIAVSEGPDGGFTGHSLYGSTWFEPTHLMRFPQLRDHGVRGPTHDDKRMVIVSQLYPGRLVRRARLAAIALPYVAEGTASRLRPATKGEALRRVAPSSLFQLYPQPGRVGFQRLARLTAQLPCYWLDLGKDLEDIPQRVRDLLAEVAR